MATWVLRRTERTGAEVIFMSRKERSDLRSPGVTVESGFNQFHLV
jgi:hypothetical protein